MDITYTQEQSAIIAHTKGHALINAVAGSGKTATMVGFIERLAQEGVDPKKVMVLMFNKTARDDFQRRLLGRFNRSSMPLGKDRLAEIRTLSSLSYRTVTLLQSSRVIDEFELVFDNTRMQNTLIRDALRFCDAKVTPGNIDYAKEVIEWIKARHDNEVNYQGKVDCKEVAIFNAYEDARIKRGVRFSSDWAYDSVTAVKSDPSILFDVLNNRFEYLVIDEFQDINACQMHIIDAVAQDKSSIIVVGDVNQSIYAWRGSDPDIMLRHFPDKYQPTTYSLTKTFRFGERLSDAANNLISHNASRFDFQCQSAEGVPDTSVEVIRHSDYKPEQIINDLADGDDYSNIAVLGRERCYWFETEFACLKHNIPYQIMAAPNSCVLDTLTVRSFLGYLRLSSSAKAFKAMRKEDRKALISGMMQLPSLYLDYDYKRQLIERLADNPDSYQIFPDIKRQIREHLKVDDKALKGQCDAIDAREEIWDVCLGLNADKSNALRALRLIYTAKELNFEYSIKRTAVREKDANYRLMMLQKVIDLGEHVKDSHESIGSFLDYINDLHQSYIQSVTNERIKSVCITTMHRAKGLEWDNVIIPDMFHDTMPVLSDDGFVIDEEGDRRLFYVAMTRAKKCLKVVTGDDEDGSSSFIRQL